MILENYNFHDSVISNVLYDGETLKIYIRCDCNQGLSEDSVIKIRADADDLRIYCSKRYPLFHNVKIRAKEVEHRYLNSFFNKGKILKIDDLFSAIYTDKLVFDCSVFPYSKKRGVVDKVYLEISNLTGIEVEAF